MVLNDLSQPTTRSLIGIKAQDFSSVLLIECMKKSYLIVATAFSLHSFCGAIALATIHNCASKASQNEYVMFSPMSLELSVESLEVQAVLLRDLWNGIVDSGILTSVFIFSTDIATRRPVDVLWQ